MRGSRESASKSSALTVGRLDFGGREEGGGEDWSEDEEGVEDADAAAPVALASLEPVGAVGLLVVLVF